MLDYLDFGPLSEIKTKRPPPVTNNVSGLPERRGGRVILLVVDDLSAKPSQMIGLRTSAERMLKTLDLGDLVGLATTSGLGPAIDPTRDRLAVGAALESREIVGRYDETTAPFYISVPEAIEINQTGGQVFAHEANDILKNTTTFAHVVNRECRLFLAPGEAVDDTCSAKVQRSAVHLAESITHRASAQLAAFLHLIQAMGTAPQPRVIIALSVGVAVGADRGDFSELEPVSRAAARAGVQFYALTEVPDVADVADISPERAIARKQEGEYLTAGVQTVAEAAGGEAFKVVGQADRFFTRIMEETSGIYKLGVDMPSVLPADEFLKAKVSIRRPGVTVRVNPHALMPSATTPGGTIEDALESRLALGGTSFGLTISCATARRRAEGNGDVQLGVNLHVPASAPPPLLMHFALLDESGIVTKAGRQDIAQPVLNDDYWLTFAVPVPTARYRLRVAVADHEGHIGAVEQPVAAELNHVGPFLASDLLTTWSAGDGVQRFVALDRLPKTAINVRASLELYPTTISLEGPTTVRLQILSEGVTLPIMQRDLAAVDRGSWLGVTADIPVKTLPPGTYTILATVLQSATSVGSISTPFRKQD